MGKEILCSNEVVRSDQNGKVVSLDVRFHRFLKVMFCVKLRSLMGPKFEPKTS